MGLECVESSEDLKTEQPVFRYHRSVKTDIGKRRSENQDSFVTVDTAEGSLLVVADGMGGVNGGARASTIAVYTIARNGIGTGGAFDEQSLRAAIELANRRILYTGKSYAGLYGMGTTVVALALVGDNAFWAHVGDSRLYFVRDAQIRQITKDHTLVQELVDSGMIPPDRAANHPIGHMLTRALGQSEEISVDMARLEGGLRDGDKFLLCCDGLTAHVADSEMLEVMERVPIAEVSRELIDLANSRGGTDNTTIIAVRVVLDDQDSAQNAPIEPQVFISTELTKEEERDLCVDHPPPRNTETLDEDLDEYVNDAIGSDPEPDESLAEYHGEDGSPSILGSDPNLLFSKSAFLESLREISTSSKDDANYRRFDFFSSAPRSAKALVGALVFTSFLMGAIILSVVDTYMGGGKKSGGGLGMSSSSWDEKATQQLSSVPEGGEEQRPDPAAQQLAINRSSSGIPTELLREANSGQLVSSSLVDHTTGLLSSALLDKSGTISSELAQSICNFKELYRDRVADLNIRLRLFDLAKEDIDTQVQRLEERFDFIEGLFEEAKVNLSSVLEQRNSWILRKQMAEQDDNASIIKVLDEVGEQDKVIATARDDYKDIAFRYFRAVELWNGNPGDLSLRSSMETLGTEMREKKKGIEVLLRDLANEKVFRASMEIADWTLAIDGMVRQKQRIGHELSLTKSYRPYEPDVLERTRGALLEEREMLLKHLSALNEKVDDKMEEEFRRNKIITNLKESERTPGKG